MAEYLPTLGEACLSRPNHAATLRTTVYHPSELILYHLSTRRTFSCPSFVLSPIAQFTIPPTQSLMRFCDRHFGISERSP